jgi:hypothetical protein
VQHPHRDEVIGSAKARRSDGRYQWALRRGTSGSFYAKARAKTGCRSGFSKTYHALPHGDVPSCPAIREPVCRFTLEFSDPNHDCRLSPGQGNCTGTIEGDFEAWPPPDRAFVGWEGRDRHSPLRDTLTLATPELNPYATIFRGDATIKTDVISPPEFRVRQAQWYRGSRFFYWYTPAEAAAGTEGGPLSLAPGPHAGSWEPNTAQLDDVVISGYLYYDF